MVIAIDAMGGDNAPEAIVAGALRAAADGVKCLLVGDEKQIAGLIPEQNANLQVVHASEKVLMDDSLLQVFRNKGSSLAIAFAQLKAGKADAVFSAGSTNALVVTSRSVLGLSGKVEKPAIAVTLPTNVGKEFLLLDAGASTDCTSKDLLNFALMGVVYAREILGVNDPKIGLVNIGEEEFKGGEVSRETYAILKESGFNFVGNVEGTAFADRLADILVCDGFTGNNVLKVAEGTISYVSNMIKREFTADLRSKLGSLLLKPAFARLKKKIDWKEWGGAVILGVKGNVMIGHGRSDAEATCNALKLADNMARVSLWEKIEKELETING